VCVWGDTLWGVPPSRVYVCCCARAHGHRCAYTHEHLCASPCVLRVDVSTCIDAKISLDTFSLYDMISV
jgi:hypothetical protein